MTAMQDLVEEVERSFAETQERFREHLDSSPLTDDDEQTLSNLGI